MHAQREGCDKSERFRRYRKDSAGIAIQETTCTGSGMVVTMVSRQRDIMEKLIVIGHFLGFGAWMPNGNAAQQASSAEPSRAPSSIAFQLKHQDVLSTARRRFVGSVRPREASPSAASQPTLERPQLFHGRCGTNLKTDVGTSTRCGRSGFGAARAGMRTLDACASHCAACDECHFVSFSNRTNDCSLYRACNVSRLPHGFGYQTADRAYALSVSKGRVGKSGVVNASHTEGFITWRERQCVSPLSRTFFTRPLVISLTTTHYRVAGVHMVIKSILCQEQPPHLVTLYVSNHSFHHDNGVSTEDLRAVYKLRTSHAFDVQFVTNNGPHRKLLPSLLKHWTEDVLLVTADDDHVLDATWLGNLLRCHKEHPDKIVNGRTRQICMQSCNGTFAPYRAMAQKCHQGQESFDLPTGINGVLYRPSFFHPVVFGNDFRLAAPLGDDISFRFATMLKNVSVATCSHRLADVHYMRRANVPLGATELVSTNVKLGYNNVQMARSFQYLAKALGDEALDMFRPSFCKRSGRRKGAVHTTEDFAVDVVYTWVGAPSDKSWADYIAFCTGTPLPRSKGGTGSWNLRNRFRDWGTIEYSVRSVQRYLPWVRRVFIVTNGNIPRFLGDVKNTTNKDITLITHKDIWPTDREAIDLPTFNSDAIESHLHRIPGLAERFLYVQDDMLIGHELARSLFFDVAGHPILQTPANIHNIHGHLIRSFTKSCLASTWASMSANMIAASSSQCRRAKKYIAPISLFLKCGDYLPPGNVLSQAWIASFCYGSEPDKPHGCIPKGSTAQDIRAMVTGRDVIVFNDGYELDEEGVTHQRAILTAVMEMEWPP